MENICDHHRKIVIFSNNNKQPHFNPLFSAHSTKNNKNANSNSFLRITKNNSKASDNTLRHNIMLKWIFLNTIFPNSSVTVIPNKIKCEMPEKSENTGNNCILLQIHFLLHFTRASDLSAFHFISFGNTDLIFFTLHNSPLILTRLNQIKYLCIFTEW